MKKLVIIITHPIQYYVPLYQLLAKSCDLKVFYTWGKQGAKAKYDPDFNQIIEWDLPLLDDYNYEFITNTSKRPGSNHFKGIINPDLIRKIIAFNPDDILVYGWAYQSHLKVLRYFKGKIPIWFRGDSNLIDEQKGIKSILRHVFLRWIYQHIDKAFYVGTGNKNYYLKFGLKPKQLIFAPHAVDNNRFSINRIDEADDLRKRLNIDPEDILILFAGKLESKKNPELLLQAFIETRRESEVKSQKIQVVIEHKLGNQPLSSLDNVRKTEVHLLFVGNGILEETLKSNNSSLNSPFIHFMPFQNQTQMPVIYQACNVFCLPSKGPNETWGLAVNEAMASGKAILVSNKVGCSTDLVKNADNGYIFESENLDDLILKLKILTDDQILLKKMGLKSVNLIKTWTINKQSETILKELYN